MKNTDKKKKPVKKQSGKKTIKRVTPKNSKPVVNKNIRPTKIIITKNLKLSALEVQAFDATGLDILQAIQALTKLYGEVHLKQYDDYEDFDYS